MKYLFVSLDGLIADIAWAVVKEGHDVKFYINDPNEKEIADGFVPKTNNWEAEVDWADLVVFDACWGRGRTPIVCAKPASWWWAAQENFTSFDDAIKFVESNPGRYVIKPSGEAQNYKRLLFVGEEEDGHDVLQVLGDYKTAMADRIKEFQLQRRIMGVRGSSRRVLQRQRLHPSDLRQFRAQEALPRRHRTVYRRDGHVDVAEGTLTRFRARSGFQVGVRIVVPPFPFNDPETFENSSKDSVILFKTPAREGLHIEDVKNVNGEWIVTGTSGVVLIVCGLGSTMKQAQRQAYNRVRNVMIPNMYYREDIGDRWFEEDSDRLHSWGYLRE